MSTLPRLSMNSTSKTTCASTSTWCKLRAWFTLFPPTPRIAGAFADDDTEGGAGGQGGARAEGVGEEEEAYALYGDE